MKRAYTLIEKLTVNGRDIDMSLLLSSTYVEVIDLSGPRLILQCNDAWQVMVDGLDIREGTEITASFSNTHTDDNTDFDEVFTVISMREVPGQIMQIELLAKAVADLKKKATTAQAFIQNSPGDVLAALVPPGKVSATSLPAVEDYYLTVGMRPSKLLRKVATENAAKIFYARGIWYLKSHKELLSQKPVEQYQSGSLGNQGKRIVDVSVLRESLTTNDIIQRKYIGLIIDKGQIESGDGPAVVTGLTSPISLANLGEHLRPEISFKISDGDLRRIPGERIGITWHRSQSKDAPFNESLPDAVLLGQVAHHQKGDKQACLIETVV